MRYNGGAAHSCSSFADLVIKTGWVVKTKLVLTSNPVFMTRSAKLAQYDGAPPMMTQFD
jgi:hypothetical protein